MGMGAAVIATALFQFLHADQREAGRETREEDAQRLISAPLALLMKTDDPELRTALADVVERTAGLRPAAAGDQKGQASRHALQLVRKACLDAIERPEILTKPSARRDLAERARQAVELLKDASNRSEAQP